MKKQAIVFLASCMLFAACGSGGDTPATNKPAEATAGQATEATVNQPTVGDNPAAANSGVAPEGQFPIVPEKIELTVMIPNQSNVEDFNTNTFTQYYEDLTNIHINWSVVPSENLTEKVNISLSSGDMPDIYLACNVSQSQQLVYGSQGAFQALNPYIAQYGSFFQEVMAHIPNLEQVLTMSDGNIYALPYIEKCPHCEVSQKMWVNMEWLDALGMKLPTTTAEFEDMLRAFKEKDPNGNGAQDEIPFLTFENGWQSSILTGPMFNPFVYTMSDKYISLDNGKAVSAYTQEGWREAMVWIHKLYQEGLYYDQSLVIEQEQARRISQSDPNGAAVVGTFLGGTPNGAPGDTVEQWGPYQVLPPLQGPAGRFASWDAYAQSNPTYFVITSACKNPEAAFRWGVEQYKNDLTYRKTFGEEGVSWRKVTPGKDGIPADAVDSRTQQVVEVEIFTDGIGWGDKQNYCWRSIGLRCDSPDFKENRYAQYSAGDYNTNMEYRLNIDTTDRMEPYRPDVSRVLPPLVFTEDQAMTIANLESVLLSYVKEMAARFITGDADINAEWDSYLSELETKGASQVLQVYQQAYDTKYGN